MADGMELFGVYRHDPKDPANPKASIMARDELMHLRHDVKQRNRARKRAERQRGRDAAGAQLIELKVFRVFIADFPDWVDVTEAVMAGKFEFASGKPNG